MVRIFQKTLRNCCSIFWNTLPSLSLFKKVHGSDRHYLIKLAQAWSLAQGKTIESRIKNWHEKLYSAVTQISILICFFWRNVPNKQKTNRKNMWTAGKYYFIKRLLEILSNPMRDTFEGILKTYFFTIVFMQFVKISKTPFMGHLLVVVFEKTPSKHESLFFIAEITVNHFELFKNFIKISEFWRRC